jgi:hypothetical protein
MASDVVCIRVKLHLSLALAGTLGMVKIDHFERNSVVFLVAVAMFRWTNCRATRGDWDRVVNHFPYLHEKLSRRDGQQQ